MFNSVSHAIFRFNLIYVYYIYMSVFPNIEKKVNLEEVKDENDFVQILKNSGFISEHTSSDPTSVANTVNTVNTVNVGFKGSNQSKLTINKQALTKYISKIKDIDTELDAIFDNIAGSSSIKDIISKKYPETSKVVGKIYYVIDPEKKQQRGGTPNSYNQIVSTPYQNANNQKLWISIFFFVISAVMIFETFSEHYEIIMKFAHAISEIIMNFENTSIAQSLMQILSGSAFHKLLDFEKQAIMREMGGTLQQIAATRVTTTMDTIFSFFTGTESIAASHVRRSLESVLNMELNNLTFAANQVQFTIKYAIPACVTSICGIFKYGQHLSINNVGSVQTRLTNLETHLAPTPRNGGFRKRTIKHKRSKKSNMASKSHKKKSKVMKSKAMKSKKRTSHKSKRSKTLKRGRKH